MYHGRGSNRPGFNEDPQIATGGLGSAVTHGFEANLGIKPGLPLNRLRHHALLGARDGAPHGLRSGALMAIRVCKRRCHGSSEHFGVNPPACERVAWNIAAEHTDVIAPNG
nr:hypothetical protein GCM10017745_51790 [Saccharothrix mutabilis subsp. capreolus]